MIVARSCSLLRAISGNDDVKAAIVNAGCISLIITAMDRHPKHVHIAEQSCAVFASLALRHPQHCADIVASGGADFILKAMKIHEDVENVQVKDNTKLQICYIDFYEVTPSFLDYRYRNRGA